jgi:ribose 5-phosphate isomerase B
MKKIVIGSDHAAFNLKEEIKEFLLSSHYEVIDVGTHSSDRCDYPDFAKLLANVVISKDIFGILLCGSGIGVSMAANRYSGIRAALCRSIFDAEISRLHNNANVICIGSRQTSLIESKAMIEIFLKTDFEAGRHTHRVEIFNTLGEKI